MNRRPSFSEEKMIGIGVMSDKWVTVKKIGYVGRETRLGKHECGRTN